jgi:hypothetical protein
MTFPVFSAGEVLRAQDMNAVGMWLVKTVTVGAGVTSVPVTSCFSADYDNYRIVLSDVVGSTASNMLFQFSGITTAVYQSSGVFLTFGSSTISGFGPAAETSWIVAPGNTATSNWTADIISPFASRRKSFIGGGVGNTSNYQFNGTCSSTSSATGFSIIPSAGTYTGGTIRVYGYRN